MNGISVSCTPLTLVTLSQELTIKVSAARAMAAGRDVELAIRPERVKLAAAPGAGTTAARVEGLVYQGASATASRSGRS